MDRKTATYTPPAPICRYALPMHRHPRHPPAREWDEPSDCVWNAPSHTTRPQPLGQALALQFALAQALVVPWWDLALAQGSTKAWHALVVPWLTEIHQG